MKESRAAAPTTKLFINLYAYRQREKRNPLEDWLTECLAATMRALSDDDRITLLAELAGASRADLSRAATEHRIEISTQVSAGRAGRPDMLVRLGGHPWLLFENKVGHGVTVKKGADKREAHQLRCYADWLASAAADCPLPPAMQFVTHITAPPDDYRDENPTEVYHGMHRGRRSWGALARRIAALTGPLGDHHHAKAMAGAFTTCLEYHGMSNEFPASGAFAAAELYVTQAQTLENLVDHMWSEVEPIAKFGSKASYELASVPHEGTVSAWRYIADAPKSPRHSFLQTGIWFPETGLWFTRETLGAQLKGPQAYVFFGHEKAGSFAAIKSKLEGFYRPASNFLACKSIAEFQADPQERAEQVIAWVRGRAALLKGFLTKNGLAN